MLGQYRGPTDLIWPVYKRRLVEIIAEQLMDFVVCVCNPAGDVGAIYGII